MFLITNLFLNEQVPIPCWKRAYTLLQQYECRTSGRCKCGPNCDSDICTNCGSMPSVAISVLQENGFPSLCGRYIYKLTREPTPIYINPESLMNAIDTHGPIICNMYIRKSQTQFLDRGPSDVHSLQKGFSAIQEGVYSDMFSFPDSKNSESRENIGHCVTIIGYKKYPASVKFRVRNSFGSNWGYQGDFNLKDSHITPQTIHILLAIPHDSISLA